MQKALVYEHPEVTTTLPWQLTWKNTGIIIINRTEIFLRMVVTVLILLVRLLRLADGNTNLATIKTQTIGGITVQISPIVGLT